MKHYLIAFISVFLAFILKGQTIQHYGLENDLSSSDVTSVCKTKQYIWIGTEDGLNRFNGHHFKTYKAGADNSIYNNNVETLYDDGQGMLWIGFKSGGVDLYDMRSDRFYRLSDLTDGKIPNRIISIFGDSSGKILLGSWEEGVCVLTPTHNGKRFKSEICLSGSIVSGFARTPDGNIFVATYNGLLLFDLANDKWTTVDNCRNITCIVAGDQPDEFYYSTWDNDIFRISSTDFRYERIYHSKYPVKSLQHRPNALLVGLWGGPICIYNLIHGTMEELPQGREIGIVFPSAFFTDTEGNLWICSYNKGLYKCCKPLPGFSTLLNIQNRHSQITSICVRDNKILLGTLGDGLFLYDNETQVEKPVFQSHNSFKDCILAIGASDDFTLIGHDDMGLLYSYGDNLTHWKEFKAGNDLDKITAFCFLGNKVWIGTKQNGLMSVKLDRKKGTIGDFHHYSSMGHDRINSIVPFRDSRLFVATNDGLFVVNPVSPEEGIETIIEHECVHCIVEDRYSKVWWIGTSRSLMRMEFKDNKLNLTDVLAEIDMPGEAIKLIKPDNSGNIWFFSSEGMYCRLADSGSLVQPDIRRSGNISIMACDIKEINGREYLFIGSSSHLLKSDVVEVLSGKAESELILTSLDINHKRINVGDEIDGNVILDESTEFIKSLSLPYHSKWISLSFANIGSANFRYHYFYRLRGFSDSWQYLTMEMPVTFSQLNSGQYTLEIRTADNATPCWSMPIEIQTPWWKSAPMIGLYILFGIGLIILIIHLVTRFNRKKELRKLKDLRTAEMEKILNEKESFFQSLGHDIMTPLSLIIAPANDMLRDTPEDDIRHEQLSIITQNASYLSNLFESMLDFRQAEDSNLKVESKPTKIVNLARYITNAFKILADSRKISLDFQSNVENASIVIDNLKFERILFNLLSNAIKYTQEEGAVSVILELAPHTLKVSVRDTGPGIDDKHLNNIFDKFYREPKYHLDSTRTGLGIGLYTVKKFVEALGGKIEISSVKDIGTTISFTLPISETFDVQLDEISSQADTQIPDGEASILLVEDNPQILDYLSAKLSEHFNVIETNNAEEGLRLAEENMPEIIISDVMLPGMDGLTMCRMIKENPLTADILVVILTAKISSEDELSGYREGADIYIRKPFDTESLIRQLENILNTRRKRKEQFMKNLIADSGERVTFNSTDEFLRQAMQVIEDNLSRPEFSIDEFADAMKVSKTVLHKKFKTIIGQTPGQFIREIRLRKAADLLENTDIPISEIAYRSGFNQAHYFIKCFKKLYNDTPKKFRDSRNQSAL